MKWITFVLAVATGIFFTPAPLHSHSRHYHHRHHHHHSDDAAALAVVGVMMLGVIGYGLFEGSQIADEYVDAHKKPHDLTLSYFRMDSSYQVLTHSRMAADLRVEAGIKMFGLQYRQTHYNHKDPHDIYQYYGTLRVLSYDHLFQLDLGFGAITTDGDEHHSGFAFTSPIAFRINDHSRLEFRPAWTEEIDRKRVNDYDLAYVYNYQGFTAKIGYRWLKYGDEIHQGPTFGLGTVF